MTDMTPKQIREALKAWIITQTQADAMLGTDTNLAVIGNEDNMRFVRSFSDVFIAIGVGLLALGLSVTAGLMGGGVMFLLAALLMALMAEYFGKRKRQHLPTLITALAFLFFTHQGLGGLLGPGSPILAAVITLGTMLLFYARVRLPFCIALIALSIITLVFTLAGQVAPGLIDGNRSWLFVLCGLVTLIAAIQYDIRDLHRTTRFADNAFWLHFLAAPLLVHGLAFRAAIARKDMLFGLLPTIDVDRGDAAGLLVIVGLLSVLGLALNRRALIVSSLGYAAFAIVFLFSGSGVGLGMSLAAALLLLGAAIVLLGAAWHPVRNKLIAVLPKWRIFPPPFQENFKG